jgi:hypothetical protein
MEDIPHKQVGETAVAAVPAGHGIAAHRSFTATTACGKQISDTLVTRRDDLVRCPGCKAAMRAEAPEDGSVMESSEQRECAGCGEPLDRADQGDLCVACRSAR